MGNFGGIILPFIHGKGRNRILFISTFFFFGIILLTSCHSDSDIREFQLPGNIQLQSGDLVFRTGRSVVSHTVTLTDQNSVYSHVGILLWTDNGWQVLHAVPNERAKPDEKDSVKLETLETFFRPDRASNGGIYRLSINAEDTLKLLQKSFEIHQHHPLFDNAFNDKDSNAFYCTELVWFIYKSELGIDLSQGKRHRVPVFPDLIFCSDLLSYPEIEKIYDF
ncbi:MAG: hypothetical protein J6S87_09775 [Bacteroidales bacterium]|nr:hypothetical protein [Bacteroidales bacterium]